MLNHSDAEKARIRDLTKTYLPPNLELLAARRDCPLRSLHIQQASYGQKRFENIGIVFEYCRAQSPCKFDGTPLELQMSAERRVDLLSELETLDPPPYHDPANLALCRTVRDRILVTGDVTASSLYELPSTPARQRLSHLGLQSLARSAASLPSTPTSTQPKTQSSGNATPPTTSATPSASKGPGRPRRVELEVTVYGYLRDNEVVTTAKGVGYLTQRKQVEFKFFQDSVAKAFGFNNSTRSHFHMYLPHVDQWTDRFVPLILVRGQPVLIRREGVRKMPGFADLKRLLNPPFDPNGVRPLSTLLDYSLGFPCGRGPTEVAGSSTSRLPSDPSSTFADIFGGPPPASSDAEEATPTRKRKSDPVGVEVLTKVLKSSSTDDVTRPRQGKAPPASSAKEPEVTPTRMRKSDQVGVEVLSKSSSSGDVTRSGKNQKRRREVIEISDSENDVRATSEAKDRASASDRGGASSKGKGKARACSSGDVIDLTE